MQCNRESLSLGPEAFKLWSQLLHSFFCKAGWFKSASLSLLDRWYNYSAWLVHSVQDACAVLQVAYTLVAMRLLNDRRENMKNMGRKRNTDGSKFSKYKTLIRVEKSNSIPLLFHIWLRIQICSPGTCLFPNTLSKETCSLLYIVII
jgi:hypothetical protein